MFLVSDQGCNAEAYVITSMYYEVRFRADMLFHVSCTVKSWLSGIQESGILIPLEKHSKKVYYFYEVI
jgi:hypothetical protein